MDGNNLNHSYITTIHSIVISNGTFEQKADPPLILQFFNGSVASPEAILTVPPIHIPGVYVVSHIGTSLGCVAILLNITFLYCMYHIRNKDSAYNCFIQNLTVCDILGSVSFLVMQNWPQGPFAHILPVRRDDAWWVQSLLYVFRSLPWMFFTAYMLTLNCLSISQYVAACKPHAYVSLSMKKHIRGVLLGVWLFASLQIVFPAVVLTCLSWQPIHEAVKKLLFISKIEMIGWMLVYFSSTCLSIVLSIIVYFKLRQLRRKQSVKQTPGTSGANTRTKNEAFITIFCLCVASIFCRLPLPLVGMLLITVIERQFGPVVMSWTLACVVLLLYLVFVVDPVIYVLRLPEARQVLKQRMQRAFTGPDSIRKKYQKLKMKRMSMANITLHDTTVNSTYV